MGRPSLAHERRPQIVAAAIECMARYGVSGTTLERIAEIAEMSRGHVRHFAGNREALLVDAGRVFFFGDAALEQTDLAVLEREAPLISPEADVEAALDYLFGEFAEPGRENAVAFAFVDAGRTIPAIHATIVAAYDGIERSLREIIRHEQPGRSEHVYAETAYAVFTLAAGNSYVNDLQPSPHRIAMARRAAQALIVAASAEP